MRRIPPPIVPKIPAAYCSAILPLGNFYNLIKRTIARETGASRHHENQIKDLPVKPLKHHDSNVYRGGFKEKPELGGPPLKKFQLPLWFVMIYFSDSNGCTFLFAAEIAFAFYFNFLFRLKNLKNIISYSCDMTCDLFMRFM